jgi:CRP/FNR family transcriptional regulator, cyclic AMP receptor protein
MRDEIDALLAKAELFREVPVEVRREVAAKCIRRKFPKGTVLFHKESTDRALYLIASGRVRIYLAGGSGQEVTLNVCGPGEAIGELSILDGRPRSASAQAIDDVVVYSLRDDEFVRVLNPSPMAAAALRVLGARLRRATDEAESLALFDVFGRLARRLLELAERHGSGGEIDLQLSQTDLASLVGATRETVNRALGAFRHQGLIDQRGHRIVILQPDLLRQRIQ